MHVAKPAFLLVFGLATTSLALPISSLDAALSSSGAIRASKIVMRNPSDESVPDWDNAVVPRTKPASPEPETVNNGIMPFKRSQPEEPKKDSINNRIIPFRRSQLELPEEPKNDSIKNRITPFKRSKPEEPKKDSIKNQIVPFRRSQPKESNKNSIDNQITPLKRAQPAEAPTVGIIDNSIVPF